MDSIQKVISEQEERLRLAQLGGDVAALDSLISDELQFVFHDGALYTKEMDLQAHRSRSVIIESLDFSERKICDFGHVAVVTVKAAMTGTFLGQAFSGTYRYIRTWLLTEGRWQIVAGSVSELAKEL
ncbi:MAG: nuclear transport factor 2 family protein [Bdellovibrionales bacterium]|nr:nuclear transport factor 2 family protein [Bdellovibrionales bacterium]